MKTNLSLPAILAAAAALVSAPMAYPGGGPEIYTLTKTAVYLQKSAGGAGGTGAVPAGYYPYEVSVQSPTAGTLTVPGMASTLEIPANSDSGDYEINESFGSKAALDAAFPDGTYKIQSAGLPTLKFPESPDTYPTAVPEITVGTGSTWDNGVVVVNPSATFTLDFSTFTTFASAGVAGHMELDLSPLNMGGSNGIQKDSILSVPNPFGITVQSTPDTVCVFGGTTLSAGGIYEGDLQFETALEFDTTTIPGSAVISLFQNDLVFYIVAPPLGIPPSPPVLAQNIGDVTGYTGGSATFAPRVTVNGAPMSGTFVAIWYVDGQPINPDGVKYISDGTSLIINDLTAADTGEYFSKIITLGGLLTTAKVTLTVDQAVAPAISVQPVSASEPAQSPAAFNIQATGKPAPTYQWQVSTNGGTSWQNLIPGGSYFGQASSTLTVDSVNSSMNGFLYRCVATNSKGSATSKAAKLTVTKAPQVIIFATIANQPFSTNPSVFISPVATSGLPVSVSIVSGPATFSNNTITLTGVGTVTVAANQAGDAQYAAAAEVVQSFSVLKGSQTIQVPVHAGVTYGDAPFPVNASATSNLPVTLTVASGPATIKFTTIAGGPGGGGGTPSWRAANAVGGAQEGWVLTLTGAGTVKLHATQAGNADWDPAVPVDVSIGVAKALQTITFPTIPNQTFGASPFTLGATSTSGLPVSYTVLGGPATISNGKVTLTGTGQVRIAASQAGNADYLEAAPVEVKFTVAAKSK